MALAWPGFNFQEKNMEGCEETSTNSPRVSAFKVGHTITNWPERINPELLANVKIQTLNKLRSREKKLQYMDRPYQNGNFKQDRLNSEILETACSSCPLSSWRNYNMLQLYKRGGGAFVCILVMLTVHQAYNPRPECQHHPKYICLARDFYNPTSLSALPRELTRILTGSVAGQKFRDRDFESPAGKDL